MNKSGILFAALLACGPVAQAAATFDSVAVVYDGGTLSVPSDGQGKPVKLPADPKAARLSERTARTGLAFAPASANGLSAQVTRVTNKRLGYQKYTLSLRNTGSKDVTIRSFDLFRDWSLDGAADGVRVGNTDGAVAQFPGNRAYLGIENPFAKLTVDGGKATGVLPREYAIKAGETWIVSWTLGRYAEGQFRRDFQSYLNNERAHPYRVLPHYNSWYDINIGRNDLPWQKRMNEAEALGVMQHFRKEMGDRGVFIDSYLWDDGWDNWDSLWDFHPGFPNGFRKLADEAHKNKGASIGAWMSPCGGYGGSQAARVRYAKSKGILGPKEGQMRMSSPTYYKAFRDRVLTMIRDYDMNIFKFDRMGVGHDCDGAPASHAPDMEAIVRLIGEMRAAKQNVFINATVGTWASPYWVMFADSIWRGDQDFGTKGAGRARQKWVTYRDNQIHDRFVAKSPLFPLNSLMSHGIIVTQHGPPRCEDVSDTPASTQDFADEVWMSVACGTDLQEYYITPALMHKGWWDILADGVKWLKANEKTLVDAHWVGGDPNTGNGAEVYGYASWKKGTKGIVILRNPSDQPQTFTASLGKLLELPSDGPVKGVKTVYSHGTTFATPKTTAADVTFSFEPFGILLLEISL